MVSSVFFLSPSLYLFLYLPYHVCPCWCHQFFPLTNKMLGLQGCLPLFLQTTLSCRVDASQVCAGCSTVPSPGKLEEQRQISCSSIPRFGQHGIFLFHNLGLGQASLLGKLQQFLNDLMMVHTSFSLHIYQARGLGTERCFILDIRFLSG